MYFEPGKYVDHWVTEFWHAGERRWVRIDSQLDAVQRAAINPEFDTEDLPPGPFLPAGEAWRQCRTGRADPNTFGIFEFWGLWFVQANVVRELAAQQDGAAAVGRLGTDDGPRGTGRRGLVAHRHRCRRHLRR